MSEPDPEPEPVVAEPEPAPESNPEPVITDPEPQPVVPATPVSISATVKSAERHVGDQLNTGDFTVTVTMSDGSTVKNPNGWTANPMTLASESNVITISYNGLTTTVTVPAVMVSIGEPPLPPEPQPVTHNPPTPGRPASSTTPPPANGDESAVNDFYDYAVNNYGWHYQYTDFGFGIAVNIEKNGIGLAVNNLNRAWEYFIWHEDTDEIFIDGSSQSLSYVYSYVETH